MRPVDLDEILKMLSKRIKNLEYIKTEYNEDYCKMTIRLLQELIFHFQDMPEVGIVPKGYCEYCRHWEYLDEYNTGYCNFYDMRKTEKDYCSQFGEKE